MMLATLKAGIAVAALVGGTIVPQTAQVPADTSAAVVQDEDQGRHQGGFMDAILDHLDVSRGDVISRLRTGGTLADLAVENGSSGEKLIVVLLAVAGEKIEAALAEGRTDETAAEKLRQRAEDRISDLVYSTHEVPGARPGLGNRPFRGLVLDTTIEHLELNQGQVVSHVRTGGTLAALADENGSSGPELETALVDAVSDLLDDLVAENRITPDQAEGLLDRATSRIGVIVYAVHTPGRGR